MEESVVAPPDEGFAERARARQERLTKPPGSLGRLEEIAIRLAAIQRTDTPKTRPRAIVLFAGDHGVTEEGVSPYPSEVTGQMILNFNTGGAAINALSRVAEADLSVVDVGTLSNPAVRRGTRNFAREPAMTEDEMDAAIEVGRSEVRRLEGVRILGLGEMGIGNTTAASVMTAALTGLPVAAVTGRGTGVDGPGLRRKVDVIERALALHDPKTPRAILASVGGLEIAALVGVCLEAAQRAVAILVDGFITTAAFAIAWKLEPAVKDYAFFAHVSVEPGHAALHQMMDVRPILDLELRLGEGTGAALAIPILDGAVAAHNEMATFESASVSDKAR